MKTCDKCSEIACNCTPMFYFLNNATAYGTGPIPEQLISNLQNQIEKLQNELSQAQKDILDFEEAAREWKKAYTEMECSYRAKLVEKDQIIKELNRELDEFAD